MSKRADLQDWDAPKVKRRQHSNDWIYAIALGGFAASLVLHLFFGASFWLPVVAGVAAISLILFGGRR